MSCKGVHCNGCRGHGSGELVIIAVIAGVAVLGSGTGASILATTGTILTDAVIAAGSVIALGVVGLCVALGYRVRRELTRDAGPGITREHVRADWQSVPSPRAATIAPESHRDALPPVRSADGSWAWSATVESVESAPRRDGGR
jgi:hypothetical protein